MKKHLQAEQYHDAENVLDAFDRSLFSETEALKMWIAKLEEIQLFMEAESRHDEVKIKAENYRRNEELAKAIGVLVSYNDAYKITSYHEEIQGLIAEYFEEYKQAKAEKKETLNIPFVKVEIDKFLSSFTLHNDPDIEVWAGVDGVIEGENGGSKLAQITLGDDNWKDWILEFEIKVPADQELKLGITSGVVPGRKEKKNYDGHRLNLESAEWVPLRIELMGGTLKILNVQSLEVLNDKENPYFPQGGFAIILAPGEKVFVRNVQYKVLVKAGEKEEAGEEEDQG